MSVLANLNSKTLELRKARDPFAPCLLTAQSNAKAFAKERAVKAGADLSEVVVTDEDALRAIQKGIKQANDTLSHRPDHAESLCELEILEGLLPSMTSEDDIRAEAETLINGLPEKTMKGMGIVMAGLTQRFGTSLDKAKASAVVKAMLA